MSMITLASGGELTRGGDDGEEDEGTNQSRMRDLERVSVSHLSIDFSECVCVQSMFLLSLREN